MYSLRSPKPSYRGKQIATATLGTEPIWSRVRVVNPIDPPGCTVPNRDDSTRLFEQMAELYAELDRIRTLPHRDISIDPLIEETRRTLRELNDRFSFKRLDEWRSDYKPDPKTDRPIELEAEP